MRVHPAKYKAGFAVASLLLATGAAAEPTYRSDDILRHFLTKVEEDIGPTRGLCIGTESECEHVIRRPGNTAPKSFDLVVTFDFNSDVLTNSARQNLDEFAQALKDARLASASFQVEGHTDAKGSETYNLTLSARRAQAVIRYLAAKGVDASKLEPRGYGKLRPRMPDPFDPANRRVEARLRER